MNFGQRIKAARKRKGLTLKELATAVGVTPQAVSAWEKADNATSISRITVIANALNVDFAWLLGDDRNLTNEIVPSQFEKAYGDAIPIVDIKDSIFFSSFNVQTSRVPPHKGLVYPTYPINVPSFAFKINDSAMRPIFSAGDLVICASGLDVRTGDYVVATALGDYRSPKFGLYQFDDAEGIITLSSHPGPEGRMLLKLDHDNPGLVIGIMAEHRRYRPEQISSLS